MVNLHQQRCGLVELGGGLAAAESQVQRHRFNDQGDGDGPDDGDLHRTAERAVHEVSRPGWLTQRLRPPRPPVGRSARSRWHAGWTATIAATTNNCTRILSGRSGATGVCELMRQRGRSCRCVVKPVLLAPLQAEGDSRREQVGRSFHDPCGTFQNVATGCWKS